MISPSSQRERPAWRSRRHERRNREPAVDGGCVLVDIGAAVSSDAQVLEAQLDRDALPLEDVRHGQADNHLNIARVRPMLGHSFFE